MFCTVVRLFEKGTNERQGEQRPKELLRQSNWYDFFKNKSDTITVSYGRMADVTAS